MRCLFCSLGARLLHRSNRQRPCMHAVHVKLSAGHSAAACPSRLAPPLPRHSFLHRPLGLLGMWGGIARRCLQDLLPEDAHQR